MTRQDIEILGWNISAEHLAHALTISVITAATAWFLFLVAYSLTAKWWKNPYGRNTFGVSFVLWVILFRLAVIRIWPQVHQSDLVGTILYTLTALFGVQRMLLMLRAQIQGKPSPLVMNRRHDDPK